MYQEAANIRDVYLYKKLSVQVGSWYMGALFYRQKIKRCHKIRYRQREITLIVHFLKKKPVGSRGLKSRMCPPYPHAYRKRRLKWGAVI